jgi:hypothetical protein
MRPREFDVCVADGGFTILGVKCLGAEAASGRAGIGSLVVVGSECIVAAGTGPGSFDAVEFVVVAILRV